MIYRIKGLGCYSKQAHETGECLPTSFGFSEDYVKNTSSVKTNILFINSWKSLSVLIEHWKSFDCMLEHLKTLGFVLEHL